MTVIPVPWFTVPSHADVLGDDGRPINALTHGYPADLTATALRVVYTEAEQMSRAVGVLVAVFGPVGQLS